MLSCLLTLQTPHISQAPPLTTDKRTLQPRPTMSAPERRKRSLRHRSNDKPATSRAPQASAGTGLDVASGPPSVTPRTRSGVQNRAVDHVESVEMDLSKAQAASRSPADDADHGSAASKPSAGGGSGDASAKAKDGDTKLADD